MIHAFDLVEQWRDARARAGTLLLALDFDGTLAPIVPRPEQAAPLPAVRAALDALVARQDTIVAIVSGRGLDDVRARLGIDTIHYAGNHGLEIDGPVAQLVHREAADAAEELAACVRALDADLADHPYAWVEDKRLTLSVHFRRAETEEEEQAIRERITARLRDYPGLHSTHGKKVVEIRPNVDWHKGRATSFLMESLLDDPAAPVLYIGDDRTDEDAFRVVGEHGAGIVVAEQPPIRTDATAWLRSPTEVATLLERLAR